MSRTPSTDLFDLIRSLTKSEKRQFKLYATRYTSGTKKYVPLFDAIDKQLEYDEDLLFTQFPFLAEGNFRSTKSNLYEMILRVIWSSSFDHSAGTMIAGQIGLARALIRKKLYPQAVRMLEKAKKSAKGYEHRHQLFEIITIEEVLKGRVREKNPVERHRNNHLQRMQLLEDMRVEVEYYHLYQEIHYLEHDVCKVRDERALEKLDEIMRNPLMKEQGRQLSLRSEELYYQIHIRNCAMRGDKFGEYSYVQKKLLFLENNDEWRRANATYEYIWTCKTLLILALNFGEFDTFNLWYERLARLDVSSEYEAERTFCLYHMKFQYLVMVCRFREALKVADELGEFLDQYGTAIEANMRFHFFYECSFLNIAVGEFQRSLYWANQIGNDHGTADCMMYEHCTRLVRLINFFELHEIETLESTLRSYYRFLKKRDELYPFEKLLMQFVRKLSKVVDREELMSLFRTLLHQMRELKRKSLYPDAIHISHMYVELWLESTMADKTIAEFLIETRERSDFEVQMQTEPCEVLRSTL